MVAKTRDDLNAHRASRDPLADSHADSYRCPYLYLQRDSKGCGRDIRLPMEDHHRSDTVCRLALPTMLSKKSKGEKQCKQ